MPTVTVRLDKDAEARLKLRLAQSGETISELVRQAVASRLNELPEKSDRLESLKRILEELDDDGETDLSETYKTRIREKLLAKHRR